MPSLVRTVLESVVPIVVDGDGLFALSWNEDGDPSFLIEREVATVLTPHDGEFGLLTGHRPGTDRIADAHRLAEMTGAIVLLKGPTTVVAAPDGRTYLVANGTERLATAGTGDVLSGLIGAFLAAGTPAPEAAAAGAWVHAEVGSDRLGRDDRRRPAHDDPARDRARAQRVIVGIRSAFPSLGGASARRLTGTVPASAGRRRPADAPSEQASRTHPSAPMNVMPGSDTGGDGT